MLNFGKKRTSRESSVHREEEASRANVGTAEVEDLGIKMLLVNMRQSLRTIEH